MDLFNHHVTILSAGHMKGFCSHHVTMTIHDPFPRPPGPRFKGNLAPAQGVQNSGWFFWGMFFTKMLSHSIHVWYIYLHENHKNQPNVGKYTIHGSCGYVLNYLFFVFPPIFFGRCFSPAKLVVYLFQKNPRSRGRPVFPKNGSKQPKEDHTWRIIPVGKWLITMFSKSPK